MKLMSLMTKVSLMNQIPSQVHNAPSVKDVLSLIKVIYSSSGKIWKFHSTNEKFQSFQLLKF